MRLRALSAVLFTMALAIFTPTLALADATTTQVSEPTIAGTLLSWVAVVAGSVVTMLMALAGVAMSRRSKDSKIWSTVNNLWVLMQTVVAHVEREIRPQLQKALSDGKLSTEEAQALKNEALRLFKEAAGENLMQLQKLLGLTEGALGAFVSGLLERAVSAMKGPAQPPAPLPAAAAQVLKAVREEPKPNP